MITEIFDEKIKYVWDDSKKRELSEKDKDEIKNSISYGYKYGEIQRSSKDETVCGYWEVTKKNMTKKKN